MLYSLRIKIISCHFTQKQLCKNFILNCYSKDKIIQQGYLNLNEGVITNNISLNMKINEQQLNHHKNIKIVMLEKRRMNSQLQIGSFFVNLNDNDNYKLRRLKIQSQIYKNAFIEAFVLLFPVTNTNISFEQSNKAEECQPVSFASICQSIEVRRQDNPFNSLVNIFLQQNQDDLQNLNLLKINNQRKVSVVSVMSNEVQTQTHNIQSLLTLNNILEEQNTQLQNSCGQLTHKNQELQYQVLNLSSKIQELLFKIQDLQSSNSKFDQNHLKIQLEHLNNINQHNQTLISELKTKIKHLQDKNSQYQMTNQHLNVTLLNKNEQIINKKNLIVDLTKKCRQLQDNLHKTQKSIDIQNKAYSIDQIVQELSKYSQTVKKYKNHEKSTLMKSSLIVQSRYDSKELRNSRQKVENSLKIDKPFSFIKPMNRKESNRNMVENKQRFNNEETWISLTQSKIKQN